MFSKTIFKQTLKQNWKLWAIFTALTATMSAVVIAVYDPRMIKSMMDMFKDIPGIANRIENMGGATSLLGMLGKSFYGLQGVILPLIFIIMTGNTLIASQVDRGSMAYTLSTPIKRTKVVCTQALYLITSVLCMFLVVTIVGLSTVQISHNGLWGKEYTPDVKAVSETMNISKEDASNDLKLILNNPDAIKAGAEARRIDEDVYTAYLNLKATENALGAAADIIGVDADKLRADPALLKNNEEALNAAAKVMGVEPPVFSAMLDQMTAQSDTNSEQMKAMQGKLMAGITAAADQLDMDAADLATQMGKIKDNPKALETAVAASGLQKEMLIGIINQQLANDEMGYDLGIDFSVKDYVNLNLGIFLLMFAISGISFLFSCIFNLTKNSLTFGAGIPIACLIFQIMSQASSDLEKLKYLSLNTLFDPSAITGGGTFIPQFIVLAVLGTALFLIGIKVFKEKDLPL